MNIGKSPSKATVVTVGLVAALSSVLFSGTAAQAYDTNGLVGAFDISNPSSFNPGTLALTNIAPGGHAATKFGSAAYEAASHSLVLPGNEATHSASGQKENYYQAEDGFADFRQGLTIQATMSFGTTADMWERIIDFGNGDPNENIVFTRFEQSNELVLEIEDGTDAYGRCRTATNNTAIELNVFTTWTVTLDGQNCHVYKDGIELNTEFWLFPDPMVYVDNPNTLGSLYGFLPNNVQRTSNLIGASNWSQYDLDTEGAFQSILVYNRALTPAEVLSNLPSTNSDSSPAELAITGNIQNELGVIGLSALWAGLALHVFSRRRSNTLQ